MEIIYNHIFVPIITYACGSWGWAVRKVHIKRKLITAQRSALIHISRAYRTTSNTALHVLSKKAPIDKCISLQEKIWHLRWGYNIQSTGNTIYHQDLECAVHFAHTKHPSSPHNLNFLPSDFTDIEIFTDGSKNTTSVGSGYVAYHNNNEIASGQYRLGTDCTVLQAEMIAIQMAVAWADSNFTHRSIDIISDSASSIALLKKRSHHLISTIIHDTIDNSSNSYHILWTRAHQGTPGNERADALARTAGENGNLPITYNQLTIKTIKTILWKDLIISWQQDWDTYNHPTMHDFIPNIEHFLNSRWYRPGQRISQFLTNHGSFHSYLKRFINKPNPNCSICGVMDGSQHYIYDCPMLELERFQLKTTIEAHCGTWPIDCDKIFDNKDTYEAFMTLINNYFVRTT
ncbi:uncharacterized protein, partial [Centruroides vittatus]|uniref:uncharacterized protein n=1 Tax=Centruroides vittatus TaxID=120091 RepID=UPI003510CCB5